MTNNEHKILGAAAALFLLTAAAAPASTPMAAPAPMSITASVSSDSAMVGDALLLGVVIDGVPKGARVVPPETEGGFGDFFILEWEDVSAKNTKAKVRDSSRYQYRYVIATYKPENCTIPAIRFLVNYGIGANNVDTNHVSNNGINNNGINNNSIDTNNVDNADSASPGFSVAGLAGFARCDTLSTMPIPIRALSALPQDPPDSGGFALKDLKAQQGAGRAGLWYLWAILCAAAAVFLFLLIRKRLKKKGKGGPGDGAAFRLPPYEEAMEAIEALDGKKYLGRGMVREYVFELSEIFKRYIGRRYDTIAPELTTEEIAAWLEFSEISREMRMCAERFFRSSDQVKFAKWVPDRPCVDGYLRDVLMFIEATKPDTALPYERKTERMGVTQ